MTFDELLAELRRQLPTDPTGASQRCADEIELRASELDQIAATATRDGRELRASETRDLERIRSELGSLTELRRSADREARAQTAEHFAEQTERAGVAAELREQLAQPGRPPAPPAGTSLARIGHEPRTYHAGPGAPSFFADLFNAQTYGDPAAQQRLARHMAEAEVEQRAIGTGATPGFVPPEYLGDLFAAFPRAGSVVPNLVFRTQLPDTGMTVTVPRVTTGPAVAAQATENTAVQNTDAAATNLTVNVNTIAGQQVVSRQLVERSNPSVDQMLFAELARAYFTELDNQMLNGSGAGGTHLGVRNVAGINAVSYTDASPTLPELTPKIADAAQRVQSNRFTGPTAVIMHPRRWGWCTAAIDTNNRPLVTPSTNAGPTNAAGVQTSIGYGQQVGELAGIPVFTDANIPTNLGGGTEDCIIVANWPDQVLLEAPGAPFMFRFDHTQAQSLGVVLVVYGYTAFAAGRYPTGIAVISGTGLAAPTF